MSSSVATKKKDKIISTLLAIPRRIFTLDLRSLAVFRIGLGIVLLGDLFLRSFDLGAFYTDAGVMPRAVVIEKLMQPWNLSIHLMSGNPAVQAILFFVAAIFAGMLLAGYRTTLSTFVSWFMLMSLHGRNPMILQGGDVLLQVLLFWSLFLPLGARWSLDAALNPPGKNPAIAVCSGGTVGLLFQMSFVYWFTAILKSGPTWRTEDTAIWYALSLHQFSTPIGRFLLNFPSLLRHLTVGAFLIEKFGPYLLFLPFWTGPVRLACVLIFWSLHLGMALCLELGPFPYVCFVAWSAFVPTWFWDRLADTSISRRIPKALVLNSSKYADALALICLGYIFLWNLRTTDFKRYKEWFPVGANSVGDLLRLDQQWGMFSPNPSREDGWYVIPGRLRDGSEVDVFRDGSPIVWSEPARAADFFKGERWHKYMMNIWLAEYQPYRLYYCQYLCRHWNSEHSGMKQLLNFEVDYMLRTVDLAGDRTPEKKKIAEYHCF